jgi:hypothetical protein
MVLMPVILVRLHRIALRDLFGMLSDFPLDPYRSPPAGSHVDTD